MTGQSILPLNRDWTGSKQAVMQNIGARNFAQRDRESNDFYATEPKAIHGLFAHEKFADVWECACGAGDMAEAIAEYGVLSKASDKFDRGFGERIDFLQYDGEWGGDIITNPPYKYAAEFIVKGISLLKSGRRLALFLPVRYLEGKTRRKIFDKYSPQYVYVSSGRIVCALGGRFEEMQGSAISFSWFIWKKDFRGETVLRWFN